jgi:hypothetical protein
MRSLYRVESIPLGRTRHRSKDNIKKYVLKKEDSMTWIEFMPLRIGTYVGFL